MTSDASRKGTYKLVSVLVSMEFGRRGVKTENDWAMWPVPCLPCLCPENELQFERLDYNTVVPVTVYGGLHLTTGGGIVDDETG